MATAAKATESLEALEALSKENYLGWPEVLQKEIGEKVVEGLCDAVCAIGYFGNWSDSASDIEMKLMRSYGVDLGDDEEGNDHDEMRKRVKDELGSAFDGARHHFQAK